MLGFYRKWIKGECRHFCFKCGYKLDCLTQLAEEEKIKQAKAELPQQEKTPSKLPSAFYAHTLDRFNNIH